MKYALTIVKDPGCKPLYFCGGSKFSLAKEDAKLYATRNLAMADQDLFAPDFTMNIEEIKD